MGSRKCFLVSVFLVFTFAISGMVFGQRVIDLDKADMRVLGKNAHENIGNVVAYGDINGDGYMDIIIGAPWADPGDPARGAAGETYVIFGSSTPPSIIDLSSQSADITIYGDDEEDWSGIAIASVDINVDGYDDIIIGAPVADPGGRGEAGETYVIFGSSSPPSTFDLSTQSADITVYGDDVDDECGSAVDSGDINGDGYDDLIIGAPRAAPGGRIVAGKTYVIFGDSFPSPPYILDLNSWPADITVCGDNYWDNSGFAVASGDVNNDGFDDIIIGAPFADPGGLANAGETYVIFGSSFPSPPYILDLNSWPADITVYGDDVHDACGSAVASGDINGDGYSDMIIGAPYVYPWGTDPGATYVIFGSGSPPSTLDLSTQSADITVCGDDAEDACGSAVDSGDMNGDGYDDLIIGAPMPYFDIAAPGADPGGHNWAGATYVIFGSSSPPTLIDLDSQPADITVYGDNADDGCGSAVASGDINGDGYSDMIIGAPYIYPWGTDPGETDLILGGGAFITAHGLGGKSWIKEFSLLGRTWGGFKAFGAVNIQGEVHLAIGDLDGDGRDEIAAGQGEGGKSWVKFFEVDGSLIRTFKAFGAVNTYGELHLAIGNFDDFTSDKEIAIAQGEGGQSWVKTFKTDGTLVRVFKAFGAANAQGEVHLASGDLNKDGIDEIIVGMGEGGSSWVKVFNLWGDFIRSFQAFNSTENPGGEVHLAVGNFDADADLEIAAATGYNGGNKVRLFDKDGTSIGEFTAFGFGDNPNGDVQITAADIDNDGVWEIICGHGEGGSSWVRVFKPDGTVIRSFKAFGAVNAQGEVHLGKSNY